MQKNMKSWVVAFVKDNKVVSFAENTDVSANNRIKDEVTIKDLPKGEYLSGLFLCQSYCYRT